MKRSLGDDASAIEIKKPQLYTSGSGTDAFRAMLMSARCVSVSLCQASEAHPHCYYCDSTNVATECDTCQHAICPTCSLGSTATCLNCHLSR
ncbi:LAME_0C04126g1_1 [Lachancea meyersii CBS 8951]|uniref:LAME_0C04126g1_1 n=1 Tax=Lachancea meyersii CBS 8951 TaxID=1266667 RepID=A0A1G4J107_9SACH|nr:LAME_0C04126g1_1 [Lachancea meyersii CBS 8951]